MMAFIGVRSSWLIRERNSLLAALACSATLRASINSSSWLRLRVMSSPEQSMPIT